MASRHLARSLAMQALYEWDFSGTDRSSVEHILNRIVDEFGPGLENKEFAYALVENVITRQKEIDAIIEKAAPEWPIDKIAIVDRNVLRIGLWELLYGNYKDVPPKVAINEAIELAKTFGGENSGKFVNGVLGTVYRELGEPGKDQSSKKYTAEDLEKLPLEKRGGAVVIRGTEVALVHDVFGYWTLPKGRITEDEDEKEGSRRAVMLELGLKELELTTKICENIYVAHDPEKGPLRRKVVYFRGATRQKDLMLKATGGLDAAEWFERDTIKSLKMYDDIKVIFEKI
ncbi:MAG: transcription antitermination factor NusB [Candidatus Ryanbacteria bacterium]|nr:transcription antitermination factor NusB [Candidatus Ryanbacteria bacterium]